MLQVWVEGNGNELLDRLGGDRAERLRGHYGTLERAIAK